MWDIEQGQQISMLSFHKAVTAHSFNGRLLSVGLEDGTVQCWQQMDDTWQSLQLKWSSSRPNDVLVLSGCDTTGSLGLSLPNTKLLEQRGALIKKDTTIHGETQHVKVEKNLALGQSTASGMKKFGQFFSKSKPESPETNDSNRNNTLKGKFKLLSPRTSKHDRNPDDKHDPDNTGADSLGNGD